MELDAAAPNVGGAPKKNEPGAAVPNTGGTCGATNGGRVDPDVGGCGVFCCPNIPDPPPATD